MRAAAGIASLLVALAAAGCVGETLSFERMDYAAGDADGEPPVPDAAPTDDGGPGPDVGIEDAAFDDAPPDVFDPGDADPWDGWVDDSGPPDGPWLPDGDVFDAPPDVFPPLDASFD